MEQVRSFARRTVQAFHKKDGESIRRLFIVDENDPQLADLHEALYTMTNESIRATVEKEMSDEQRHLREMTSNFLMFTIASSLDSSSFVGVYELLAACYRPFLSLYQSPTAQWLTPLLMDFSYALVRWANFADDEIPQARERKISDAASSSHLLKALQILIGDKSSGPVQETKRWALFYVANLAFRVYFKLHSTRFMNTLITNIEMTRVKLVDFPMRDQVTYRYYQGRYHLYNLNLRGANHDLTFAFTNRPAFSQDENENNVTYQNSRLTLIYLTACRLCLGRMPSLELLENFNLSGYFYPLMEAIKLGNLALLDESLSSPDLMNWFANRELYFLLKEKLRVLCWRSLIRRIWLISRQQPGSPPARVDLHGVLSVVLAITKDDSFDMLDIESITASLLDQGYIRGYIHHQRKVLVLSKTNPFPVPFSVRVG
ncbi:hypothetical protein EDD11_003663 [Mortierella claussenii]|nr:hypothetical protein EDD11_003663 [Mortierella claussenii]